MRFLAAAMSLLWALVAIMVSEKMISAMRINSKSGLQGMEDAPGIKDPQVEDERNQQEQEEHVKEARRNLEVYADRVEGMLQSKEVKEDERFQVQGAMKGLQEWIKSKAGFFNFNREEAAEEYDNKREELEKVTNPILPLAKFSPEDLKALGDEVEVMETEIEVEKVEPAEDATQNVTKAPKRKRVVAGKEITKAVIFLLGMKALPSAVASGESNSNQVAQMEAKYDAMMQQTQDMMQGLKTLESEIKAVRSPNSHDDKGPGLYARIFGTSSYTPDGSAAEHQQPDAFQDLYQALDLSMHSQVAWKTGERHRVASLLTDKGVTASQWTKALHEAKQPLRDAYGQSILSARYDHSSKFYTQLAQDLADGVDVGAVGGIGQVNANFFNLNQGSIYLKLSSEVRNDLAREMALKNVKMSSVEEAIAASKVNDGKHSRIYQHNSQFIERLVRDVIAGHGGRYKIYSRDTWRSP